MWCLSVINQRCGLCYKLTYNYVVLAIVNREIWHHSKHHSCHVSVHINVPSYFLVSGCARCTCLCVKLHWSAAVTTVWCIWFCLHQLHSGIWLYICLNRKLLVLSVLWRVSCSLQNEWQWAWLHFQIYLVLVSVTCILILSVYANKLQLGL